MRDDFFVKGSTFFKKPRRVELYMKMIAIFKPNQAKPYKIMCLDHMKCVGYPEKKKKRFIFCFISQQKQYSIYTQSPTTYLVWMGILRRLVLVDDFHEKYEVMHKIGSGGFARVTHHTVTNLIR